MAATTRRTRDGAATRDAILDAAEDLVLEGGYAGTSLDAILGRAGVTKGAFFHHFESKQSLALALVERYNARDAAQLMDAVARAERLARDPLQRHLILIGLMDEFICAETAERPGCLMASYCYELGLMGESVRQALREAFAGVRELLAGQLREVAECHPPRLPCDLEALADMPMALVEGAFILARVGHNRDAVSQLLQQYRNYIELLFSAPDVPNS